MLIGMHWVELYCVALTNSHVPNINMHTASAHGTYELVYRHDRYTIGWFTECVKRTEMRLIGMTSTRAWSPHRRLCERQVRTLSLKIVGHYSRTELWRASLQSTFAATSAVLDQVSMCTNARCLASGLPYHMGNLTCCNLELRARFGDYEVDVVYAGATEDVGEGAGAFVHPWDAPAVL